MTDKTRSSSDRILTGAVWSAIGLVFILLTFVGYLFYKLEAKKSDTLVQRELRQAENFESSESAAPLSHVVQGELYYRQGKAKAAEKEFREALKIEPSNPRALINLGTVYVQQQQYDDALLHLLELVRLRKNSEYAHIDTFLAEAYYQIALIKSERGQCGKAIIDVKAAIAITPMDADAHFALGHCHLVLKQYKEAIAAFKESTAFDPEFAQALYELGQAYEGLGDTKSAIDSYNHAVNADPQLTKPAKALQRLQEKLSVVPPGDKKGDD